MAIVCAGGAGSPGVSRNVRAVGSALRRVPATSNWAASGLPPSPAPPTLKVTGRMTGLAAADVTSTYPKYTPLARFDASALTVSVAGVAPDAGVTESQFEATLQ